MPDLCGRYLSPPNNLAGSYFNFLKSHQWPTHLIGFSSVCFCFLALDLALLGLTCVPQNSLPYETSGSVSSGKFLGQVEFLHTLCTPCTTAHPCTCTWELSCPPENETLQHEAPRLAPITLQGSLEARLLLVCALVDSFIWKG